MITLNPFQKLLLAIVAQVLIVACLFLFNFSILQNGSEVYLRIRPIDPRDPFRGDYVVFTYDISDISYYYRASNFPDGSEVYVPLCQQSMPYWQRCGDLQKEITDTIDDVGKVYIKGRIQGDSIVYGIENYFIPEGVGRNVNFNSFDSAAKVRVDQSGNAVLEKVYLDGKPWP